SEWRFRVPLCDYSARRAIIGSTAAACRAGTDAAANAIAKSRDGTMMKVARSCVVTPNNIVATNRDRPNAAMMPIATPASAARVLWPTIRRCMAVGAAPSASRIPISIGSGHGDVGTILQSCCGHQIVSDRLSRDVVAERHEQIRRTAY